MTRLVGLGLFVLSGAMFAGLLGVMAWWTDHDKPVWWVGAALPVLVMWLLVAVAVLINGASMLFLGELP